MKMKRFSYTLSQAWHLVACSVFMFVLCTQVSAQAVAEAPVSAVSSLRMGFLSNSTVMQQMPQYAEAQRNLAELKSQYETEARRSEKEFQTKFEEFLQNQKNMPETILKKRQNELQSILDANIAFRTKVQSLLAEARENIMADVKAVLKDAISSVAQEKGLNIVVNTDGEGITYVTPGMAEDITSAVMQKLGILKQ